MGLCTCVKLLHYLTFKRNTLKLVIYFWLILKYDILSHLKKNIFCAICDVNSQFLWAWFVKKSPGTVREEKYFHN